MYHISLKQNTHVPKGVNEMYFNNKLISVALSQKEAKSVVYRLGLYKMGNLLYSNESGLISGSLLKSDVIVVTNIRPAKIKSEKKINLDKKEIIPSDLITLTELERLHILKVIEYTEGNKTKASKILQISVKALFNKLKQYNKTEILWVYLMKC